MTGRQTSIPHKWWKLCALSLSLAGVALWISISRNGSGNMVDVIKSVPLAPLPLLALLTMGTWTFHGCRYWVLARMRAIPISLRECIAIAISVDFSVAATPSGSGGAVARMTLLKKRGVKLHLAGSIFTVNIFNDLCVSALLLLSSAIVVAFDPEWRAILRPLSEFIAEARGRGGTGMVVAGILLFAIALAGIEWWKTSRSPRKRLPAVLRRIRWSIYRALRFLRASWADARHILAHHRWAVLADFFCALGQWTCRYGALPVLTALMGRNINPVPLFAIQGCLFLLGILLVLPGGGGGIELLSAFILPAFVPPESVPVVLIIWRFFSYYLYLLVGPLFLAWILSGQRRMKEEM
jgi:glycosyltransferase 2 family protein